MIAEQVVALRVSRPAGIIIGVLAIALLDALVWGVMTTQMLTAAQGQLASTTQRLGGGTSDLASSQAEIAQLTSDKRQLLSANAQLASEKDQLTSNLAALTGQAATQAQCITALHANVVALQGITALARTNLARTEKGSAWARAYDVVLGGFGMAASEEIAERESSPHLWIAKGRAAITTIETQMSIVAETTATIDAARVAATAALAASASVCGS